MTNVILALGWASVTIIHDPGLYGAMFAVYSFPVVPTHYVFVPCRSVCLHSIKCIDRFLFRPANTISFLVLI